MRPRITVAIAFKQAGKNVAADCRTSDKSLGWWVALMVSMVVGAVVQGMQPWQSRSSE